MVGVKEIIYCSKYQIVKGITYCEICEGKCPFTDDKQVDQICKYYRDISRLPSFWVIDRSKNQQLFYGPYQDIEKAKVSARKAMHNKEIPSDTVLGVDGSEYSVEDYLRESQ